MTFSFGGTSYNWGLSLAEIQGVDIAIGATDTATWTTATGNGTSINVTAAAATPYDPSVAILATGDDGNSKATAGTFAALGPEEKQNPTAGRMAWQTNTASLTVGGLGLMTLAASANWAAALLTFHAPRKFWSSTSSVGSGTDFGTTANWKMSDNTAAPAVPAVGDIVYFDGADSNVSCTISGNVEIGQLLLQNSYSGTVMMSATTLTKTLTVDGSTSVSSGTLEGERGTTDSKLGALVLSGTLAISGGTVDANNSHVDIAGAVTISGTGALNATMSAGATAYVDPASTLTMTGGTFTTAGGAVTVTGDASISGGTFTNSTSSTTAFGGKLALSGAAAVSVTSGTLTVAGATTLAGTATYTASASTTNGLSTLDVGGTSSFTLGGGTLTASGAVTVSGGSFSGAGAATLSSTLGVSAGTYDTNGGSSTVSGLVTVSGGTYKIGSSATGQTLNGGLTVSGGTLNGASSTGVLKLASGTTLQMTSGTFQTTTASTSGPTIQSVSGTYTFSITGGTVAVSGLSVANTTAAGLSISSTPTISTLDDINFANVPATVTASASQLTINVASLTLFTTGDKFNYNPATYTATKNITLPDSGGAVGDVIVHFQSRDDATNGQGRGDAFDADQDTAPDDGVGDTGNHAVAYWDYAVADDTAGTAQGFPTAAFDWTTFAFYSVYSVFDDVGGAGTADRIYVRDTNGTPVSSYDIANTDGNVVGTPLWTTESGQHVLYVATSKGKIFRLVDTAGTLALAASPWNSAFIDATNVKSITTALVGDGTNVYFAGSNGSTPFIYGVSVSGKALVKQIAANAAITATPNVGVSSGSTYLFVGSSAVASQAYIYRVDVAAGMVNATCTQATSSVNGATRLGSNVLYAGDSAGKLHGIDAFNFISGGFVNKTGFPYQDTVGGAAINTAPYFDRTNSMIYFGDSSGYLHGVSTAGSQVAQLQVSSSALSSPLTVTTGKVLVGDAAGNIYYVNTSTSTYSVYFTESLGSGTVTSITYDADSAQYMAATSAGRLVYLPTR